MDWRERYKSELCTPITNKRLILFHSRAVCFFRDLGNKKSLKRGFLKLRQLLLVRLWRDNQSLERKCKRFFCHSFLLPLWFLFRFSIFFEFRLLNWAVKVFFSLNDRKHFKSYPKNFSDTVHKWKLTTQNTIDLPDTRSFHIKRNKCYGARSNSREKFRKVSPDKNENNW